MFLLVEVQAFPGARPQHAVVDAKKAKNALDAENIIRAYAVNYAKLDEPELNFVEYLDECGIQTLDYETVYVDFAKKKVLVNGR